MIQGQGVAFLLDQAGLSIMQAQQQIDALSAEVKRLQAEVERLTPAESTEPRPER